MDQGLEYRQTVSLFSHLLGLNDDFLSRFPNFPDLTGKKVLELGCGHGALSYDLAKRGAARVVGVDLDQSRIEFARQHTHTLDPELGDRLVFSAEDLHELEEGDFDIIISKSTFEHVMALDSLLAALHCRLKKGGKLYTGFGPLYYSFDGDHGWVSRVPWLHLLLPTPILLQKFYRKSGTPIQALEETTFNRLSYVDYVRIFGESDFTIEFFKVNASEHPVMRLFSALRLTPALKNLFSRNIYAVLVR